ncbi:hypothetical protein [Peribacillus frigoritolerans]|uniref:hypothetical protein n=1 Tax=Peribacillus frigoritolerans TaxID=450367 RepID=UPI003F8012E6
MVNIKARVISFPNEYGRKQFDFYFKELGNRAQKSHIDLIKFDFVLSAIDFLRYVSEEMLPKDIPGSTPFKVPLTIVHDGREYNKSFELIKPLRKENIYELRIDFDKADVDTPFDWHFRVIFFPFVYEGDLFHCFLFPFQKTFQVKRNLTDFYRDKASSIYYDLQNNPEKYGNCF